MSPRRAPAPTRIRRARRSADQVGARLALLLVAGVAFLAAGWGVDQMLHLRLPFHAARESAFSPFGNIGHAVFTVGLVAVLAAVTLLLSQPGPRALARRMCAAVLLVAALGCAAYLAFIVPPPHPDPGWIRHERPSDVH